MPAPTWRTTSAVVDPPLSQAFEERRRQVEACGRRGDGAWLAGEDRLVTREILLAAEPPSGRRM